MLGRERAYGSAAASEALVRRELMPDRLHPNAAGHAEWVRCLVPALAAAAAVT